MVGNLQGIYEWMSVLLLSNEYEAAETVITQGLQHYPADISLWEKLAISENNLHHHQKALFAAVKAKTLSHVNDPSNVANMLYDMVVSNQEIPPIIASALVKQ